MNTFKEQELNYRREKLLSIIPSADLRTMYRRTHAFQKQYCNAFDLRKMMIAEWHLYEDEVKKFVSFCWGDE